MRRAVCLLLLGALQIGTSIALAQTAPVSDAEILRLIRERIEIQHRGMGIVFGVIDRRGSRIISYGQFAKGDPRPVTFQADASGRASALVLHQNGRDMPAPRKQ